MEITDLSRYFPGPHTNDFSRETEWTPDEFLGRVEVSGDTNRIRR